MSSGAWRSPNISIQPAWLLQICSASGTPSSPATDLKIGNYGQFFTAVAVQTTHEWLKDFGPFKSLLPPSIMQRNQYADSRCQSSIHQAVVHSATYVVAL